MNPRCQQFSPLAANLRKIGAILVLVFFWLLLAFALPAHVSANVGCEYFEDGNRWECPEEEEEEEDEDPTPEPTPDPPQQQSPPQQQNLQNQQTIQLPPQQPGDSDDGASGDSDRSRAPNGSHNSGGNAGNSQGSAVRYAGNQSVQICLNLPPWIQVFAYTQATQCQVVSGAGIGLQSILDAGPLGAVDIWGPKNLEADVCFAAWGKIIFLNAMTVPRSQQTPPVFYPGDGSTCVFINKPGAVILMPGDPDFIAEAQAEAEPAPEPKKVSNLVFLIKDDAENAVALSDCRVRARQYIFVRMEPAGQRTGLIIAGRTMTALARTDNWFKVMLDDGERWVSAHFVNMAGPCLQSADDISIENLRANSVKLSNRVFLIKDAAESAVLLEDCQISTRKNLRVRTEPAGQRTGLVMAGRSLTAIARTENWYMVELDGAERWVSAHFVNMRGPCQPQAGSPTSDTNGAFLADERDDSVKPGSLAFLLEDDPDAAVSLEDCRITARHDLHARMTPAGQNSDLVLEGRTLTSLARTENWFLVLIGGAARWVSADFVNTEGSC